MLATCMLFVATMLPTKEGHSQIVRSVTIADADDTLVNADTADVSLTFDGSFKSVEGLVEKVSGTVAGSVTFQGQTLDGGTWADIDALTLTNVASQYKLFAVPNPRTYKAYRLRFITSGTTSVKPKVYTLRYTGG
ncbi:MAG TPA: hypothetical protein VFS36_06450 [Chitinophagaceae bacterium]|nr:hypothetical protein [Chitinophagaceae bacterium]